MPPSRAGRYWRKFKNPVVQRLTAPATHIEFCPAPPHDYAVTTGLRVSVMDYASSREKRAISKFKDAVLSGSYRSDGRLLVTGGVKPQLQVFDMGSRAILRTMKGHDGPVHVTRFSSDNTHVFSAGDDCSVRFWDVSSGECVASIPSAHADYIRCGQASPSNPTIFVTGSYDHTVRVWDLRLAADAAADAAAVDGDDDEAADAAVVEDVADDDEAAAAGGAGAGASAGMAEDGGSDSDGDAGSDSDEDGGSDGDDAAAGSSSSGRGFSSGAAGGAGSSDAAPAASSGARLHPACVLSVDHGAPVTQVLLLPGGGTLLSAGGNYVRLWDLVGGGRLLHQFSHHQKLITCMTLDGTRTRLITAGLDSLIKVHELATFTVVASLRADAPILSLAVSPDNARLVVGGTDASLTIRHRVAKVAEIASERAAARLLRGGTYRYFMRGQSTVAAASDVVAGGPPGAELTASGKVKRRKKLAAHDAMLKRFEYGAALDAALLSNDPVLVTSVLEELAARDGLHKSLGGRDEERLAPLLGFLTRHVNDPKHASVLLDVGERESPWLHGSVRRIRASLPSRLRPLHGSVPRIRASLPSRLLPLHPSACSHLPSLLSPCLRLRCPACACARACSCCSGGLHVRVHHGHLHHAGR